MLRTNLPQFLKSFSSKFQYDFRSGGRRTGLVVRVSRAAREARPGHSRPELQGFYAGVSGAEQTKQSVNRISESKAYSSASCGCVQCLTSSASMCLFFWLKNFDGLEKVERSWDIGCLPVFTGFLSPPTPQGRGYPCF